jgi:hypothetical protein
MDEQLRAIVLSRLKADAAADADWSVLVVAALQGPTELEARLENAAGPAAAALAPASAFRPATAHLASITVEGFRGIGPAATLELTPGPGLTLVVGRNGSGKSSFAEALEVLLTGNTFRWQERTQVWRDAWRSLHHPVARIEARFVIEGERGACVVARRWKADAALEAGVLDAQIQGKPRTTLEALGWSAALRTHRPLLSYDELGALLDGSPSALFDAMALMLGLDDLVVALQTLQKARLARERARKETQEAHGRLLPRLRVVDDERARRVVQALEGKRWHLDEVERIIGESTASLDAQGDLDALRRLATLELPDPVRAQQAAATLRESAEQLREVSATLAGRARDAVELLERALAFHDTHGDGDCPVCGAPGALRESWHTARLAQIDDLRAAAEAADAAHRRLVLARREAETIVNAPAPALLGRAQSLGLDAEPVRAALDGWEQGRHLEDPGGLATHLDAAIGPLRRALETLRAEAARDLDRREDAWRPVAAELAAWLPRGRAAVEAAMFVSLLSAAEDWLKNAAAEIRRERFAPIATKAMAVWELLRRDSNVSLEEIGLAGQGTHRRVDLNVTVDGVGAAALGVMSQGELRALALSLFIPRASLPESPFRFLVIDDPVQSMDPARVDGLARVLEMVARSRGVGAGGATVNAFRPVSQSA